MTIRAKLGQFTYDAYNPSKIEVFFEFLNMFGEVSMPDGHKYRLSDGQLEVEQFGVWELCTRDVNYFLKIVNNMTPEEWATVKRRAAKEDVLRYIPDKVK